MFFCFALLWFDVLKWIDQSINCLLLSNSSRLYIYMLHGPAPSPTPPTSSVPTTTPMKSIEVGACHPLVRWAASNAWLASSSAREFSARSMCLLYISEWNG
jgi:hypothetical protein